MKILTVAATLIALASVLVWRIIYKRMPKSLSQMVKASPKWEYIFAGVLAVYGITTWLSCIDRLPENLQWLLWLTEVGLVIVAVTPITNKDSEGIHLTGALMSAISINTLALLLCPYVLLTWTGYLIYTFLTDCLHKKLVAEIVCGIILTLVVLLA